MSGCAGWLSEGLMRPLTLSDGNKDKATEVVAFAERPENWYHAGRVAWTPGDRSEYVTVLDTYRCVYTHTVWEGRHFRHLSISVPGGRWPSPIAVFTLATFFGFTGADIEDEVATVPGLDWDINMDDDEQCIVVVQEQAPQVKQ